MNTVLVNKLISNISILDPEDPEYDSAYDSAIQSLKSNLADVSIDDFNEFTDDEIKKLLDICKDAYYNTGDEVIDDATYDELEKFAGLENVNYVGSKSSAKHANYTVKHSFIMGSLSKVQIKEDKKTGIVDWDQFADEINKYFRKARGCKYIETTPKLDGCSFSAEFTVTPRGKAKLISCATRGDGEYGSDISHWFIPYYKKNWTMIDNACANILDPGDILCIRGEVLVSHSSFNDKYADSFTNPRSFVSGSLGQKSSEISKDVLASNDLRFVCYDYRIVDKNDDTFTELSWMNPKDPTYKILAPYLGGIGELPESKFCQVHNYDGTFTGEDLQEIYEDYDQFRKQSSEYALDGIVFKPEASARQYNDDRARPVDCVAMKFIPMINATEIIDIEWNVKKTGEYFPKAIIKPIYLDGKEIKKASLHNYNYIMKHQCGIGSSVRISLAGDIIPFVYEIVNAAGTENINLPEDSRVVTEKSGNMHLMKVFNDDSEIDKNKFIASANALNINTIGPAAASMLWDNLHDEITPLDNIVYLMSDENCQTIEDVLGNSKTINNIITNLKAFRSSITLEDIILSFCFKSCGHRASSLCAKIIRGENYSTASFSSVSYTWAEDPNSPEYGLVTSVADMLGVSLEPDEVENTLSDTKIPIIMTGSPKECGFNTKKDFLNAHPEYVETTSWSECKILFTDDLNSTSGKMKKAAKAGIPVKVYELCNAFHNFLTNVLDPFIYSKSGNFSNYLQNQNINESYNVLYDNYITHKYGREFPDNNYYFRVSKLVEGLITTTDYEKFTVLFNKHFDVKLYNESISYSLIIGCDIDYNYYIDNKDDINNFIKLNGYFISTEKEFFENNIKMYYLQILPKFLTECTNFIETDCDNIVYHITPAYQYDKINKIGLVPKSKNKKVYHLDRIYCFTDEYNLNVYKRQAISLYKNNGQYINEVINHIDNNGLNILVLKIDLNKYSRLNHRWFYDPHHPQGIFTYENISPECIEILYDFYI